MEADRNCDAMQAEFLIPLRVHCRRNQNKWPRLSQWHHWIYSKHPIAKACVKKIGGRYLIDLEAFNTYVKNASLQERNK